MYFVHVIISLKGKRSSGFFSLSVDVNIFLAKGNSTVYILKFWLVLNTVSALVSSKQHVSSLV